MPTGVYGGELEDYIINEVKAPLTEAIAAGRRPDLRRLITSIMRMPEPTRENTGRANSLILIQLRDEFFSDWRHKVKYGWARPIWNGVIILYEYDQYYGDRIDFVYERWRTKPWISGAASNADIIAELMREFFKFEDNPNREPAFRYIWEAALHIYGKGAYWRYPVDWILSRLPTKPWPPRQFERPWPKHWREWGVYGRDGQPCSSR